MRGKRGGIATLGDGEESGGENPRVLFGEPALGKIDRAQDTAPRRGQEIEQPPPHRTARRAMRQQRHTIEARALEEVAERLLGRDPADALVLVRDKRTGKADAVERL